MTGPDEIYDKVVEIVEEATDFFGGVTEPFAKRDEEQPSVPSYGYEDVPPDDSPNVVYSNLDVYDNDVDYEYDDDTYTKK